MSLISHQELKGKRWYRLYIVFYVILVIGGIALAIGINEASGYYWIAGVLLAIDLIYHEGIVWIITGHSGKSIVRIILTAIFSSSETDGQNATNGGSNTLGTTKYDEEINELFTNRANPFFGSVFLGQESPSGQQLAEGRIYSIIRGDQKMVKNIKKTMEGFGVDVNSIEKNLNDIINLNYSNVMIKYLTTNFPKETKENEGDNYIEWLGNEGARLYTENASLEYFMPLIDKISNDIKKIILGFYDNVVQQKERLDTISLILNEKTSKTDRLKYIKKVEKMLDSAEKKYSIRDNIYELLTCFEYAYNIVSNLDDASAKGFFASWISAIDTLILNYQWVRFYIDGYFESDRLTVNEAKKESFDPKKKYTDKDKIPFLFPDAITFAKVMKDINRLLQIESAMKKEALGK